MGYQYRPAEPDVVGFGTERPPRKPWVTTLGVISPDGTTAAVPVFATSDSGGSVTIRLVNLNTDASRTLDVVMDPSPGYQIMAWSPDSRWQFVPASGGRLVAVDAHTGQATGLGVSLPAIDQVAIRNAPG